MDKKKSLLQTVHLLINGEKFFPTRMCGYFIILISFIVPMFKACLMIAYVAGISQWGLQLGIPLHRAFQCYDLARFLSRFTMGEIMIATVLAGSVGHIVGVVFMQ